MEALRKRMEAFGEDILKDRGAVGVKRRRAKEGSLAYMQEEESDLKLLCGHSSFKGPRGDFAVTRASARRVRARDRPSLKAYCQVSRKQPRISCSVSSQTAC